MRIIIFCLLLLVVFPYDNSLCFDCQTALGNLCIACKSTGCNPYSVYAASTSTHILRQSNAFAETDIILIMMTLRVCFAADASWGVSLARVHYQQIASLVQPTSPQMLVLIPALNHIRLEIGPQIGHITFWASERSQDGVYPVDR